LLYNKNDWTLSHAAISMQSADRYKKLENKSTSRCWQPIT